jgi:steroid 5-alpha reductase family enzyme
MIYVSLFFVVVSTYLAATAESRADIVINTMAVMLNLLAVVLHLIK